MGFSDNIFNLTGGISPCKYRITVCGDSGVYIEGVFKILDIGEKQIILKVKDYKLKFVGDNLKISSYYEGDVSIKGSFISIIKERDFKWRKKRYFANTP